MPPEYNRNAPVTSRHDCVQRCPLARQQGQPGALNLGALGYVVAAQETLTQMAEQGLAFDEVVVPSGSGNTHAGMLFGLRALGSPVRVTGICVRREAEAQRPRIRTRCNEIAALLGLGPVVDDDDIILNDAFFSPGYGQFNEAAVHAMKTAAECEGLILDPVYTAKTMAGFLDRARDRTQTGDADRSLLFIHTGGTPAAFAYVTALTEALA